MTTSTVTASNYTDEQIATLEQMYTGADNAQEVTAIAQAIGKSPASVRSKLSNMGLYVKAEKSKTAKGEKTSKADLATYIGEAVGLNEVEVQALTKTTVSVLNKIVAHIAQ